MKLKQILKSKLALNIKWIKIANARFYLIPLLHQNQRFEVLHDTRLDPETPEGGGSESSTCRWDSRTFSHGSVRHQSKTLQ